MNGLDPICVLRLWNVPEHQSALRHIAQLASTRQPKPKKVEILDDKHVFVRSSEHHAASTRPRIVDWLCRSIRRNLDNGELYWFHIVYRPATKTSRRL